MTDWKAPDWMIESLQSFEYDENEEDIEIIDKPLSGPAHILYGTTWTADQREAQKGNPFFDKENQTRAGAKGGRTTKDNQLGIFHPDYDSSTNNARAGKKGTKTQIEQGIGMFALTPEERSKLSKKNGKITTSQRWKCLVTGHISTPGGLSNHQKGLGIDYKDKSLRIKVTHP